MAEGGERFAGGMLLSNEERISTMNRECDAWTEIAWDIYRRHKSVLLVYWKNLFHHKIISNFFYKVKSYNKVAKFDLLFSTNAKPNFNRQSLGPVYTWRTLTGVKLKNN